MGRYNLNELGSKLVMARLISADQLAVALETKRNLGGNFGHILLRKGFVTVEDLESFLKYQLDIKTISVKAADISSDVMKLVPSNMARKHNYVPLKMEGEIISIALADPIEIFSSDEIENELQHRVEIFFATDADVEQALDKIYRAPSLIPMELEDIEVVSGGWDEGVAAADRDLKQIASGAQVVAEVNRIIQNAVEQGASDIHIEPQRNSVKIRNRVDGVLEEYIILSKQMHLPVITRIKIMSGMDIAERRIPQDGRVRLKIFGKELDIRVSTYPTMYGEKIVMRLLGQSRGIGLEELGFAQDDRERFIKIISQPHGIFLVTGPTGSGKTTTLYAALQRLNSQDRNIISIEDPIENEIVGVNQAQVNIKAGLTFASALRSILRQDPDVIMIGEIRDKETADIAVRSAITGHLVFSTLHTNTAIGAVTRLVDLGLEPFLVSSGIVGLLAQRLVRKICDVCKVEDVIEPHVRKRLGLSNDAHIFKGKGCDKCRHSGYLGRLGVFELLVVDQHLRDMIAASAPEDEMLKYLRENKNRSIRDDVMEKVLSGMTTLEEAFRVT